MHDGWKPYRTSTACRHALCNVQHLRELTFVEEELQQPWAGHLKTLLREMKAAVAAAQAAGGTSLPPSQRHTLHLSFRSFLECQVALFIGGSQEA